jgi:hypothetical protein
MISSILLIIFGKLGIVNPDVSLGFWKWYALGITVELIIYISALKWLDKKDLETNYGRNKK